MRERLTTEEIASIRQFRERGIPTKKIAEAFGLADVDSVYYHTSEKYKVRVREYAKKRDKKHQERVRAKSRKYMKENHQVTYPSMCLSLMKQSLRNGWITEERILRTIEEIKKEAQQ